MKKNEEGPFNEKKRLQTSAATPPPKPKNSGGWEPAYFLILAGQAPKDLSQNGHDYEINTIQSSNPANHATIAHNSTAWTT